MAKSNTRRMRKQLLAWLVPLAMVIIWEIVARYELLPPSQSTAPSRIALRLMSPLAFGELLKQALYSLLRLFGGVVLGACLGISSGTLLAHSRTADRLLSPTLQFLAPIPAVVWIPFTIMFFGLGEASKIALVAAGVFFLLHVNTFQAMRNVERDYLELADIYEKTYKQKVLNILLPSAAPSILTALRISLALGWVVLFVAEYADSRWGAGGLGWFIADARGFGRVEDQFAGMLLLGLVGLVSDKLVVRAQRHVLAWSDSMEVLLAQRGS